MASKKLTPEIVFPSINRVLFATDFSPYSDKARDYTASLARALKAEVIVFHAIAELGLAREDEDPGIREWCERLEGKMQAKLKQALSFFRKHKIRVRGELRWGAAWRAVLALAEEEGVGMIVVGSHQITGADDRIRLGTTSHRLALASPVPVLIVRPDGEPPVVPDRS